jgi:hypothetical protein
MADNTTLNSGAGGDKIATDDLATLNGGAASGEKVQRVKVGYGADGDLRDVDATHGLPTQPLASENHLGEVGGRSVIVSANFNRPANTTAYASGDLVANNTTAGSVTVLTFNNATRIAAGSGMVRRARIKKSDVGVASAAFRVHLFSAAPTVTNGDNGVLSMTGLASYLGALDVIVDQAFTDGAFGAGLPRSGSEITFRLASGSTIYGLLEARGAYPPANAETFTVELEILQD